MKDEGEKRQCNFTQDVEVLKANIGPVHVAASKAYCLDESEEAELRLAE